MNLVETAKPYEFKPENLYVATHRGSCFVAATNSQAFSIKKRAMSKVKRLRRICKCGCGEFVKPGNRFINGHNARGPNHPMFGKRPKRPRRMKPCECGCGGGAELGRMFMHGHNRVGIKGKDHPGYGSKQSEATKKKRSESMKGKNKGPNHPMFGKKQSAESNKKRSESNKGKNKGKYDGPNHPHWRGGIQCDPYCPIFSDPEFKEMIFGRDGYECQNPLCRKNCDRLPLVPHHINYDKMDCDSRNIIALCCSCNSRANHSREFWQKHYEGIMERRGYGKKTA